MDNGKFIVCRASAGSGKTYTLVKQYLEFAFDSNSVDGLESRFKRILAITFTNKAVNEMKSRILLYLKKIANHGQQEQMCRDLMQSLAMSEEEVQRRARCVHGAILHNYSDFSVCTIDSFMHHIVRTFARDLGLPVNFETTIDEHTVIENSVDTLMNLSGNEEEKALSKVLDEFVQSQMENDKSSRIEDKIREQAKNLFMEEAGKHLAMLKEIDADKFIALYKKYSKQLATIRQTIADVASAAIKCYRDAGLADDDFPHSYFSDFLIEMAAGDLKEFETPTASVQKFGAGEMTCTKKKAERVQPILDIIAPTLTSSYHQIMALQERYNTIQMVQKDLYTLALLNRLYTIVEDYYTENELLHISEFNKRIYDVVQNEPVPFIYERIGNRYSNYLIDEFQDTSRMQWLNLVPLVANGIANGHASLIVGDGKQAIYRFRQGDVHQFSILPKVEESLHCSGLEAAYQAKHLDTNYRTCHTIVTFNNRFFEWTARNYFAHDSTFTDIYIGQGERPSLIQNHVHEGGFVSLTQCDTKQSDGSKVIWQQMLSTIHHQVNDLGYRYSDFIILARSNNTLLEFSNFITENDPEIPLISSQSFLLSNSRVVTLICDFLRHLVNPKDRAIEGLVLRHLIAMQRLPDSCLEQLLTNNTLSLTDILHEQGYDIHCNALASMDLYNCCETVIRLFQLSHLEPSYAATFLNTVANYGRNHRQSLREFLEWFDDQIAQDKLSTSTSTDLNAIRLMTIHSVKGLESKIILYPIIKPGTHQTELWINLNNEEMGLPTSRVTFSKKKPTSYDKQYQEEASKKAMDDLNLLYVALTRPEQKLLMFCSPESKNNNLDYNNLLLRFIASGKMDDFPHSTQAESDHTTYTIGEDTPAPQPTDATTQRNKLVVEELSFPLWEERIVVATTDHDTTTDDSIRLGIQTHDLLSQINNKEQAHATTEQYITQHQLSDDEAVRLRQQVQNILSHAKASQFFDAAYSVKNESSLSYHGKTLRPDRIVFTPNATWIVDFKTGRHIEKYSQQVQEYCAAIDDMGLYPKAKGYLLYITAEGCEVEEV